MTNFNLGNKEAKFAELIWSNEPIQSGELVKLCQTELNWKKSTTYTMLKRLCQRGLFQNESGVITSIIKKNEFYSIKSKQFVDDTFDGSLPKFLTAFSKTKKLSQYDINEIKKLIDEYKEV